MKSRWLNSFINSAFALSFVLILSAGNLAYGLDDALRNDFVALKSYDLGMSEIPVRNISEAVRASGAGDTARATAAELETELIAVLAGDSTVEAKRFVCRMLGEIGGPAGVTALAGQLTTPETFNSAVTALEQTPLPEAARALIDALPSAEGDKWMALMAALGRQGLSDTAAAIIPYLAVPDSNMVYAASQALAALQSGEACESLFAAFRKAEAAGKPVLADACLQCATTLLNSTSKDAVLEDLNVLAGASFPAHVRLAASRLLIRTQSEKTRELLTMLLRDSDPSVSAGALMLARSETAPPVTEALVALLDEVPDERKAPFLDVLGARGDVACLAAVQSYTNHEVPAVRQAALRATGRLCNAEATDFLIERVMTGTGEEQRIARDALTQLPDPAVNTHLLAVAEGAGDEAVRSLAITLLAARRATETVPKLFELAKSASPALRAEAVTALRTLAPGARLNDLLQLVLAPDLSAITAVLPQTLADVAQRQAADSSEHPDAAAAVAALSQQLRAVPADTSISPEQRTVARRQLLETLALIGTETAYEESRALVTDGDAEVRKAAIIALGHFQRTEALAELQAITGSEQDAALRASAYTAYLASLRTAKNLARKDVDEHLHYAFEQARDTASRREFLATAAQLPSLACLRLIEQLLEQEDVAAEAVRAALTVSTAVTGACPEAARARLKAIAEAAPTPELVHEAKTALNFMRKHDDYLMTWEMAGPYFEDQVQATALFERTFPPETDVENANWRVLPLLVDADPAYALELDRIIGGEDRVLYLRTFISAKKETDALLELGTNDGCRVWWNGNLIHSLNVGRALVPGEDKLPVHLNNGVNTLMLAVFQQGGAWRATARLTDPQGQPLQNLSLSSKMPKN